MVFGLLLAAPFFMAAQTDVEVTAIVSVAPTPPGPAKVIFKGIAYPGSNVTIQKDGSTVAVVPADPTARFEVEIGGLSSGTYTFSIFAVDAQGRTGRASNFTLLVTEGTTTTVTGVFLGPTIAVNGTDFRIGETITLLGVTAPQSEVTVIVSSETDRSYTTTADGSGAWVRQFVADDLGVGTHSARAKSTAPTMEISAFSDTVSFSVSEGAPKPCDGKRPGDLNCDGKVNLSDFSILLYFWKKTNPANARADINGDGVVNIRDLSILLFWWSK